MSKAALKSDRRLPPHEHPLPPTPDEELRDPLESETEKKSEKFVRYGGEKMTGFTREPAPKNEDDMLMEKVREFEEKARKELVRFNIDILREDTTNCPSRKVSMRAMDTW